VWNFFLTNWSIHNQYDEKDENNYCLKWATDSMVFYIIDIVSGASVVVMNSIIAYCFSYVSKFKKKHTTIEEQSVGFS
jgi:hypothetical protein